MKCANWMLPARPRGLTLSGMRTVKGTRIGGLTSFGFGLLVLGLGGCEGGQTGDLSGQNDGGGTETSSGCDEHRQELASFDEETDAGSANQLLAFAERTFDAPLTWVAPTAQQSWSVGPESGRGQLHLAVARGQSAYWLTYSPRSSGSGVEIAVQCPPAELGVEARVEVTTDGGALNEVYDVLLRSSETGIARLSVPLDPAQVSGELSISSSSPDAKLVQLSLDAALMGEGMTGTLAGIEQTQHGTGPNSAVSASRALLAVWPDDEACRGPSQDGRGLGVAIDDDVRGFTGEAALASLTPAEPPAIRWLDGASTTLRVSIEASGDGCSRASEALGGVVDEPSVSYPVRIALESADGRLDGSYAGSVVVSGSGSTRRVAAEARLELSPNDVADSGFASVDVPASADRLQVLFDATPESGTVRLVALTSADCPPANPQPSPGGGQGSPGCAGDTQTPVESASWGE